MKRKGCLIAALTPVILILLVIAVLAVSVLWSRHTYKSWVLSYLYDRYGKEFKVDRIPLLGDPCRVAQCHPADDTELTFWVYDKYGDHYLEACLERSAEQEFNNAKSNSAGFENIRCYADFINAEGPVLGPEELYDFYKENGRPPQWDDLPDWIRLDEFTVITDLEVIPETADKLAALLNDCSFRASVFRILGNEYSDTCYYVYDPDTDEMIGSQYPWLED
ncbi:MAG: hypothetical protein ACI38A_07985 [Candidatus Ornithomonoglobus sp.]